MSALSFSLSLWLVAVAIGSAAFALFLLDFMSRSAHRPESIFADPGDRIEFLFDGETLVDATPSARALLQHGPLPEGSPWQRLSAWLRTRIPDAQARLAALAEKGRIELGGTATGQVPVVLTAELRGGLTAVRLMEENAPASDLAGEDIENPVIRRARNEEVERLRACVAAAPVPMWQETPGGDVAWSNRAYLDLAIDLLGATAALTWPLPRLFAAPEASARRQRLGQAEQARWYDVFLDAQPSGGFGYAVPADSAVQAEASLKSFLQTLTKTFAHLSTGLAIFDADRRLTLFNPALTDLVGLPAEFLSARPSLAAFFDALREKSMLPEPRDYVAWRRTVADLEHVASGGLFEETWSLAGGQTYRVIGRPHPNGGLALLIEDISTEMTQTRRYRADLELGQAVIDAMDEAVAVFSAAGVLVMSNAAYAVLWKHDPASTLDGGTGIAAICNHWRQRSAPTTLWDRAEDFVGTNDGAEAWRDTARLADGRALQCRFANLAGGAKLTAFRVIDGTAADAFSDTPARKRSAEAKRAAPARAGGSAVETVSS